jgi:hypothetical protein
LETSEFSETRLQIELINYLLFYRFHQLASPITEDESKKLIEQLRNEEENQEGHTHPQVRKSKPLFSIINL